MRNAQNILVGKPEGKRPFGRSSRRWESNIRIYLRKIGWKGVNKFQGSCEQGNGSSGSIKDAEFLY
jgi:hypothetical protein